jgi:hypothetical protein
MEPKGSLPCSQEPTSGLCLELDESSLQPLNLFLQDAFWYYPPIEI